MANLEQEFATIYSEMLARHAIELSEFDPRFGDMGALMARQEQEREGLPAIVARRQQANRVQERKGRVTTMLSKLDGRGQATGNSRLAPVNGPGGYIERNYAAADRLLAMTRLGREVLQGNK